MQIRKHSRFIFDVFMGNGFDNWSRIRKFHWGYKVINGNKLTKQDLEIVSEKCERHPFGGIESV